VCVRVHVCMSVCVTLPLFLSFFLFLSPEKKKEPFGMGEERIFVCVRVNLCASE